MPVDYHLSQETDLPPPNHPQRIEAIFKALLKTRGLEHPEDLDRYLNPPQPSELTFEETSIDAEEMNKATTRIKQAISHQELVVIFGDYDCDGVCATAILWETLNSMGAKVMPYLPHRQEEGFGLSRKSLKNIKSQYPETSLIITVDTGITNLEEVATAKEMGVDVVITDHHQPQRFLPKASAIVYSPLLSGAGVAWMVAKIINPTSAFQSLDLLTLATIGDLVPLTGPNRSIVYHGLKSINQTERPGLKALLKKAGLETQEVNTFTVSHVIAPRINATGRLDHALDSLRLLCTGNSSRAEILAKKLQSTNKIRQELTESAVEEAKKTISADSGGKLIFITQEQLHEGIIGLIASRLVDEFFVPTVVISKGEKLSKASARSIPGFDLTEAIQSLRPFLVDGGGHPLAAGFTLETAKITQVKETLMSLAEEKLDLHSLKPSTRVDFELHPSDLDWPLWEKLNLMQPFGPGNPTPTFLLKSVPINRVQWVGRDHQHLKFFLTTRSLGAIGFNFRDKVSNSVDLNPANLIFTLTTDTWNNQNSLLLKLKAVWT